MKFILDFAAKTAGLKDATELADKLGEELKGDETAGKQMAAALKAAADKAERALSDTLEIAEKLGDALGSDMRQAIGQSKIDEMAVKFQQAGLQAGDLDGNLDSITDSIKRMDAASGSAKGRLGEVGDAMHRVGRETDNSRSVMANFAGNAAQELPGMAGAFGPLNMAIGQFTEYATEGNISMKGLAATAGPMLGVGAAIMYANNQLDLMKKKDAFRADRVKSYVKVINESGNAVENLADHIREVGKVQTTTFGNNANPFADATVDITDKLIQAGLTVEQYSELVVRGADATREWAAAQEAAGNKVDPGLLLGIAQDTADYAGATDKAAASAKFFGEKQEDVAKAADKAREAIDKQAEALWGLQDARNAANGAVLDQESASFAYLNALDDLAGAVDDTSTLVNEQAVALNQAKEAALGLAEATVETARKQAEANGVQYTAVDGAKQQLAALEYLAAGLDPSSDLYKALQGYIDLQKQVLTDVRTTYGATFADVPQGAGRSVRGKVQGFAGGTKSAPAGVAWVGEQGPELVNFRGGESVTPAPQSAAIAGGSTTINVTVNTLKADADIGRVIADSYAAHIRNGGQRV